MDQIRSTFLIRLSVHIDRCNHTHMWLWCTGLSQGEGGSKHTVIPPDRSIYMYPHVPGGCRGDTWKGDAETSLYGPPLMTSLTFLCSHTHTSLFPSSLLFSILSCARIPKEGMNRNTRRDLRSQDAYTSGRDMRSSGNILNKGHESSCRRSRTCRIKYE